MIIIRRSFLEKNSDITYHLYDGDHLVTYTNLIPFDQEAIAKFKEGERGWFLGIDHIEQFQPGKLLECVMIDMATTPTVPPARRGTYAQILLEGFARNLVEWGQNGIEISKVYAASNTASGIRILKHAGFQTIKDLGNGRYVFELDIDASETRILLGYKEAIRLWKEQQNSSNTDTITRRKRRVKSEISSKSG